MVTTPAEHALRNKRIVITGASGRIASALARVLALDNEVIGVARFGDEQRRAELEAAGVCTIAADLLGESYSMLPSRADHVLHLVADLSANPELGSLLDVNAVVAGRVLSRYRSSTSALVMSTGGVYRPHVDPWHQYVETDALGDPVSPASPAYGLTKVAQEAVARFAAQEFDLPVVIARMNAAFGLGGGLITRHVHQILRGEEIVVRGDPVPYSPIYDADIATHLGPLLAAATVASTPTVTVNVGGDEVVTVQQWCAYIGELCNLQPQLQVVPVKGSQSGVAFDVTARRAITGPDPIGWRDGLRRVCSDLARTYLRDGGAR